MFGFHGGETEAMLEAYSFAGAGTVCDVGCGSGAMMGALLSRAFGEVALIGTSNSLFLIDSHMGGKQEPGYLDRELRFNFRFALFNQMEPSAPCDRNIN